MSARCPSCGFESADGAAWCDFCKEPFVKKTKAPPAPPAPPPDPLAGMTKEQVQQLDVDKLLKPASEPVATAPPWLRPISWLMLGLTIVLGTIALFALQRRYRERLPANTPSGARPTGAMAAPTLPFPPPSSPEPPPTPTELPPQPPPPPPTSD